MFVEAKQGYYELVGPRTLFNLTIPVLLGMVYTEYNFQFLRVFSTIETCIAIIVLQVFMNVNDGYRDYKRGEAVKTGGHRENPISKYYLNLKHVLASVWVLFIIPAVCATPIGFQTNIYTWIVGAICYTTAISYSTDSHISSVRPFGEVAACSAMGFGIFLVMVYTNACPKVSFNWDFICPIILAAGIPEICNLTLVLGSNLYDHDTDITNDRHMLISYVGVKGGLYLFVSDYLLGFFSTGWATWIDVLPWSVALILICTPTICKNMRFPWKIQTKPKSFPKVAQNTQVLFITEAVGFFIGLISDFRVR